MTRREWAAVFGLAIVIGVLAVVKYHTMAIPPQYAQVVIRNYEAKLRGE